MEQPFRQPFGCSARRQGPRSRAVDDAGRDHLSRRLCRGVGELFSHRRLHPGLHAEFMTFATDGGAVAKANCKLTGCRSMAVQPHRMAAHHQGEDRVQGRRMSGEFPLIEYSRWSSQQVRLIHRRGDPKAVRGVLIDQGIIAHHLLPAQPGPELRRALPRVSSGSRRRQVQCCAAGRLRPGDDVIVPTAGSCGVAKERMESQAEMHCYDWFFCTKKIAKDEVLGTILKK